MKLKIALVLFLLFGLYQFLFSQPSKFQIYLEDYLSSFPENTEVAIGIVDKDDILKYGYRIKNGETVPVQNSSTLFEIGSISKTFTAALLMKEVENGTMLLNDPIQKHFSSEIKQDTYQGQALSILHLATHTSGLKKNPLMNYNRYSNYLSKVQLDYVPGKSWEYNNMGISLLAKLIAEKNNAGWSDVLRENVLKPLGMTSTFSNRAEAPEANRVQCVKKNGTKGECYFHKMGSFHWPSGGIISNVDDMTKWLNANLDKNIKMDLAFIQKAHDPLADTIEVKYYAKHKPTQGIIWQYYRTESEKRILCHMGHMPQQSAFLAMDKEKNRGIIILTNVNSSKLFINPQTPGMSNKKIVLALDALDL